MKKITILIFIISIFTFSLINLSYSYNISLKEKELNIFKIKNISQFPRIKKLVEDKIKVSCFNSKKRVTTNVSFQCKTKWGNSLFAGCGFIVSPSYKEEKATCILKVPQTGKQIDINLSVLYNKKKLITKKTTHYKKRFTTNFPDSYNIFNKLLKRSIQHKHLSCEISATSDILSTVLKRTINEEDLLPVLKISGTNPFTNKGKLSYFEKGKRIWGDPRLGFVGFMETLPNGRKATQTQYGGYGVFENPIKDIYDSYGVGTTIITGENRKTFGLYSQKQQLTYLLKELVNGNYIQLWGDFCTLAYAEDGTINSYRIKQSQADKGLSGRNICPRSPSQRKLEWYIKKKDGSLEYYKGISGEHNFILLGYKGGINNPTDIIVWDTSTGKHIFPIKEWLRKWTLLGDRSILIYRK